MYSLRSGGRQPPSAAEGCGIAIGHALSGVRVQKVQRVQRVVVSPLRGDEIYMPPCGGRENQTTAPTARWKCTPSAYGTSPRESVSRDFQVAMLPYKSRSLATPEGEVLAALCLKMLMGPKAERRAKFPLRGKGGALAPKGVHFRERSEVCLFSLARRAVVWFYHNSAFHFIFKGAHLSRCRRQHL